MLPAHTYNDTVHVIKHAIDEAPTLIMLSKALASLDGVPFASSADHRPLRKDVCLRQQLSVNALKPVRVHNKLIIESVYSE